MMHHTGPAGESHRDHILFKEEAFCHGDGGGGGLRGVQVPSCLP